MNNLIATTTASLAIASSIAWFITAVYFAGVIFEKPMMMGHGTVNDVLFCGSMTALLFVHLCFWHMIRCWVAKYLESVSPKNKIENSLTPTY